MLIIYSYVELPYELKNTYIGNYYLFTIFYEIMVCINKYFHFTSRYRNIRKIFLIMGYLECGFFVSLAFYCIPFYYCDQFDKYPIVFVVFSFYALIGYVILLLFSFLSIIFILSFLFPNDTNISNFRGLSSDIINLIPTTKIPPDDKCMICLEESKNEEEWMVLNCDHKFHKDCLIEWLKINKYCPYCRKEQGINVV